MLQIQCRSKPYPVKTLSAKKKNSEKKTQLQRPISRDPMASQEPIDHGPFANRRSKKLDAKYLTSDEKEWLGRQICEKRVGPTELAKRYGIGIPTLKHYAKTVSKGKKPQESGGAPRKINSEQLDLLRNAIGRNMSKNKGKKKTVGSRTNCVSKEAYRKLTIEAMDASSAARGKAPMTVKLSDSSIYRYNQMMKVGSSTNATTKTTAASREMGDGRNLYCSACVLGAHAKDLSPHVRINGDAVTYAMGKVTYY